MNRQITVKGTGNVSVKPDLVVITLDLENQHREYDQAMQLAADSVVNITSAIESVGFNKKDLKTTSFNVRTHYKNYKDKDNNYKSRFDGFVCEQALKIEFGFDSKVMSNVLSAISKATVNPKMNVQFSVKDKTAVSEELLINSTKNARNKAEILSQTSGVELGNLISIDYNWGELHLFSSAKYDMEDRCMAMDSSCAPEFEPDDIDVNDSVTFVWEIK